MGKDAEKHAGFAGPPLGQVAQCEIHRDRLACLRAVATVGDPHEVAARRFRQGLGVGVGGDLVVGPGDDEHRAAHSAGQRQLERVAGAANPAMALAISDSGSVSRAHAIASSICFVEWRVLNMRTPMNQSRKSS